MVCAASHRRDELLTTTAHSDTIKLSVDSMATDVTQKIMYYNAKGYDHICVCMFCAASHRRVLLAVSTTKDVFTATHYQDLKIDHVVLRTHQEYNHVHLLIFFALSI